MSSSAPPEKSNPPSDTGQVNGIVHEGSGKVGELLKMAVPLAVSFISFSLMGVVDALIMGRVGTVEQGAVGLGAIIAWLVTTIFVGTMSAVNTFVAQDYGANKPERLRRHVFAALLMVPFFTAAVWALIPLIPKLIGIMGTNEATAGHLLPYVRIRLFGAPFLLALFAFVSFLRGLGDMRTPMIVTIAANILNAILTVILVFGYFGLPEMGTKGAALGSLLALVFEMLVNMVVFLGPTNNRLYKTRSWAMPTREYFVKMFRIGFPIGFTWMFDMAAWTLFSIYASTLTPVDLAAHTIIFQVMHFSFLPAVAISVAGTTLVGQYLGAGRPDIAKTAATRVVLAGVGYMALFGVVMILFRNFVIGAFNPDPTVIAKGAVVIVIAGLFQPLDGLTITIIGCLRGAGDTRIPMMAIMFSAICVFLPGVLIFGDVLKMGLVGAWTGALIHVSVLGLIMLARFRYGSWVKMLPPE